MTELWFDREFGRLSRRGAMLYASGPDGIWAVLRADRTYPADLDQESAELLGLYGASVHGVGHLLLGDDVRLPSSLEQWSTAPGLPMAQLGSWVPRLISIDEHSHLALTRDFDGLRIFATTWTDQHLTVVVPSTESTAVLRQQGNLDAPPPGWDQHGS
ncbi:MAG: hypothetical protein JWN54_2253 [Mycobacterium sp.]|jgi:hypothetical protein|nr:hypothetical protein [Mycobacterium sp.]